MKKKLFLIPFIPLFLFAQESVTVAEVTTNLWIESDVSTNVLGWSRQVIMDDGEGGIIDRSGQVVAFADITAQRTLATNIQSISTATLNAVTNSMQSLWEVTNQVPSHAEHISLYLPQSGTPLNLTGEVIEEGTSGDEDYQIVKYSQYLAIAPNRHIRYVYMNTTAIVSVVWDDWDPSNLTHRCTFPRPDALKNKTIRSYAHEIIGGDKGFDFGSALVTVDGSPTFTGEWTNKLDGTIHTFKNGVKIKTIEETSE